MLWKQTVTIAQTIKGHSLAALLHDVGHGPMSHQFESFMPTKKELREFFGNKYSEVFDLINNDNDPVEHEHISLIFASIIFSDIRNDIIVDIDPDNVLKIIEKKYSDQKITCQIQGHEVDILPLLTSIISSCPIDADRMDYLLRDSYFSGVKSGIYDYNRLFMSIVPVESEAKLFLAYKKVVLIALSNLLALDQVFSLKYISIKPIARFHPCLILFVTTCSQDPSPISLLMI